MIPQQAFDSVHELDDKCVMFLTMRRIGQNGAKASRVTANLAQLADEKLYGDKLSDQLVVRKYTRMPHSLLLHTDFHVMGNKLCRFGSLFREIIWLHYSFHCHE